MVALDSSFQAVVMLLKGLWGTGASLFSSKPFSFLGVERKHRDPKIFILSFRRIARC